MIEAGPPANMCTIYAF